MSCSFILCSCSHLYFILVLSVKKHLNRAKEEIFDYAYASMHYMEYYLKVLMSRIFVDFLQNTLVL